MYYKYINGKSDLQLKEFHHKPVRILSLGDKTAIITFKYSIDNDLLKKIYNTTTIMIPIECLIEKI